MLTHRCLLGKALRYLCLSIAYQLLMSPLASIYDRQRVINWLYHDIDSAHTADVHLLSQALWPSTLCLIICVIHQSTLQRLRDHWKLTCSLLTSMLSTLEVLPRNALDKSTYLLRKFFAGNSANNLHEPLNKCKFLSVLCHLQCRTWRMLYIVVMQLS